VARRRRAALPAFLRRSSRMDDGREVLLEGFSADLQVRFASLAADRILIEHRNSEGQSFALHTTENRAVEMVWNDGKTAHHWSADHGTILSGQPQHIESTGCISRRVLIPRAACYR
jgi:hypothetical protein